MKKIIFLGLLIGLLFTQNVQVVNAKIITGEIEVVLNRTVDFILYELPGLVKEIFVEKVIPIWKEMYEWFKESVWEKIKPLTDEEIARRKQIAEEEAQREREELLEEIGEISIKNSIWDKIKEFWIELWN